MKTFKRCTLILMILVMMISICPVLDQGLAGCSFEAYGASDYYKVWNKSVSEEDLQKMSDKWPDYEPLRCNGWMTEVMNEVYKIPMNMGNWVEGTRYNFINNSTVKPVKVVQGDYSKIKKNMDKVKPGDIVFFNYAEDGKGVWSHVAIMGEDNILWHCTATSPGSKTGKYMTLTKWMKKYGGPEGEHGSPGSYAEVWRVLSSFKATSTINVRKGRKFKNIDNIAKYKKGNFIIIKEKITYTADGPLVGRKVNVEAGLNVNIKTGSGYEAGKKIASGERLDGRTTLKYRIKESGSFDVYYRFRINSKYIKQGDTATPQVKIYTGTRRIRNFHKAGKKQRTVSFE